MATRRNQRPGPSNAPVAENLGDTWEVTLLVAVALVAALAFGAYANSLRNGFVWDDRIILSRQLVVFNSLQALLVTPRDIPQYSPDYYRPLSVASFLVDRALGGDEPFVYHLSVVIAHAGVSLLVLAFGWSLFGAERGGRMAATAGATLFAVHPIHTESVAWIAGRTDVLATLFLLAALVAHRFLPQGGRRTTVVGVLALLALAAKETAISVIPLLVLGDILTGSKAKAGRAVWWPGYAGVGIASVAYLALRRASVGGLVGEAVTGSPVVRSSADLLGSLWTYLVKLVWPTGLNAYIDTVPTDPVTLVVVAATMLALLAIAVSAWRAGRGTVTFLLLWLMLTLAPSLAIVWKSPEAPMAERYLYLPSVAACLLAGYATSQLWMRARSPARRVGVIATLCAVVATAALATSARNRVWRDDLALWTDTAAKSHIAGLPMRSLGVAYLQRGQSEEARRHLDLALQRRNSPAGLQVIYNNLGTIAMQAQRYDEARRHYEAALKAYPNAADTLFNLGLAILQVGGGSQAAAEGARVYFQRAEQLSPHDADIQAALGKVAAIRGNRAAAIAYLRRALELGPSPAVAHNIQTYLETLTRGPAAGGGH